MQCCEFSSSGLEWRCGGSHERDGVGAAGRRSRRSSIGRCSSATPRSPASQLSPDGQYLSFIKPFNGTRNIWVKKADEPFANARAITNDQKRPIGSYFWSRDSKYVLYSQDQGGDENFNVYAVDPKAAPAAGQPVPAARNLTDAKGVRALIYSVPKSDPDTMYVGINDRDKAWHDLYKVKISTGERTLRAREQGQGRRLGVRRGRPAAPRRAHHRQRQHRDPARRQGRARQGLRVQRLRDLPADPLPQGRHAGLHDHQQGRRRSDRPGPVRPGVEQDDARRERSEEARRSRQRDVLGQDRRSPRDAVRGRARPLVRRRTRRSRPTSSSSRSASRARTSTSSRPPPTSSAGSSSRRATPTRARCSSTTAPRRS